MDVVFSSLRDALTAGYYIESRTPTGYTVRTRTHAGWTAGSVRAAT